MPKRCLPSFMLALALAPQATGQTSFCDDSRFVLEWGDEFDFDYLDERKWSKVCSVYNESLVGLLGECAAPFPTHSNGTHGAECRSGYCVASAVRVSGGILTLTSERVGTGDDAWITGAVKTKGKSAWSTDDGAYRVCIRAKLPGGGAASGAGQGIWPAHWMMPADDPCDPDEGSLFSGIVVGPPYFLMPCLCALSFS
jgi:beta-glucanase (GH16 family)